MVSQMDRGNLFVFGITDGSWQVGGLHCVERNAREDGVGKRDPPCDGLLAFESCGDLVRKAIVSQRSHPPTSHGDAEIVLEVI